MPCEHGNSGIDGCPHGCYSPRRVEVSREDWAEGARDRRKLEHEQYIAARARNIARYVIRDLVDDHDGRMTRDVLGVLVLPGACPRLVSCGAADRIPNGPFSLNEVVCTEGVIDGNPHRPHVTKTSVMSITEKQHNLLLDCGFLDFERPGCFVEVLEEHNPEGVK